MFRLKKFFIGFSVIFVLSGCLLNVIWNSIEDKYEPYIFEGKKGNETLVRFQFYAPSAQTVYLAGEFNGWTPPGAKPAPDEKVNVPIEMKKDPKHEGMWYVEIPLKSGRYQYKYVIDGIIWREDKNAPELQDDGFGGKNSVIYVK